MVDTGRNSEPPPRILLAKIGLDGHDRGIKVLARSFRDSGMDVIYTGLWQTCTGTMQAALQEDVDVVGVSLLSAAHMTLIPELIRVRSALQIEHIPIVLGGIIPAADHPHLLSLGVAAIFNPGSSIDAIVAKLFELAETRRRPATPTDPKDEEVTKSSDDLADQRRLATAITAIEREEDSAPHRLVADDATLIGITGAPGVGKSSFIARLAAQLRSRGQRVAVVAVDPTSPLTGGALLGDRIRMMSVEPDANLFIRSLASAGIPGGLAPRCQAIVDTIGRHGFDYILVETVGTGQIDLAIRDLTEHIMLLLMPSSGDAIQFSKSGIIELASCFIINKSDLPGADATEGQLRGAIGDRRPIWRISTVRQEGLEPVADWVRTLRS